MVRTYEREGRMRMTNVMGVWTRPSSTALSFGAYSRLSL